MANFTAASLNTAQLFADAAFQKNELKYRDPVSWRWILQQSQSGMFMREIANAKQSAQRPIQINYFKRSKRALGSSISHDHTGGTGDSGILIPTWSLKSDVFMTRLKQENNIIYNRQQLLNNELVNLFTNFIEELNSDTVGDFIANRASTAAITNVDASFNTTRHVWEIAEADKNSLAQIAEAIIAASKYNSMGVTFFMDTKSWLLADRLMNQGAQNAVNTSFQFGKSTFIHDAEINAKGLALDPSYTKGFFIGIVDGMVGCSRWYERQYDGAGNDFGPIAKFSNVKNPIDGETYAIHAYSAGHDGSGANSNVQDVKTEYQAHLHKALLVAPNSTTGDSPIFAFAIV